MKLKNFFRRSSSAVVSPGPSNMSIADYVPPVERRKLGSMEASQAEPVDDSKYKDLSRADNMLRGFSEMYQDKTFADVILCVGDREFPCHRNVLAVSSMFFMGMFSNDLMERDQPKVRIEEITAESMERVLDYVYTGCATITEDNVQGIISASNQFQMINLRYGGACFMENRVNMSNAIGVYFFARAHECKQLAGKSLEIIHKNFTSLCKEQEFLMLPKDQLQEILNDDRLNVTSEETVFESSLAWIKFDIENRQKYVTDIMSCTRFANISSYYFCDKVATCTLLTSDPSLKQILDDVKYYHMLKNRQSEIDLNYMPRSGMTYERGIIIIANPHNEDSSRKFNSMEFLIPSTGAIYLLNKIPEPVYMPAVCITGDNQIFLAGGAIRKINFRGPFTTEGVSNKLFAFDKNFDKNSWQVKAQMQIGRSQFCLAIVDGIIFAVGGMNETRRLDSVEAYNITTNKWSTRQSLPQALRCCTAVGYRGALYVFGGEKENEIVKTAYKYNVTDDIWLELPSMNQPRALAGSIVFRDKIYVIGGNSAVSERWRKELLPEECLSTVEVFDPINEEWSTAPQLPNALCGAGILKYGKSIMCLGGEDDRSWMAGCFILKENGVYKENGTGDPDEWVEGQELTTAMSTFGCAMANIPKDMLKDQVNEGRNYP